MHILLALEAMAVLVAGKPSPRVVAAGLPLPYAHGLVSPLAAAAPATIVADISHASPEVVAPAAGAVPMAAAAPSREAVLTTAKLNPGHADCHWTKLCLQRLYLHFPA